MILFIHPNSNHLLKTTINVLCCCDTKYIKIMWNVDIVARGNLIAHIGEVLVLWQGSSIVYASLHVV